MKNSTSLLTLALTAATFAQVNAREVNAPLRSLPTSVKSEPVENLVFGQAAAAMKASSRLAADAIEFDLNVISEQPEGELVQYLRAGGALYENWGYVNSSDQAGIIMNIVTAPDGETVYMQDPVSMYAAETWVKAKKDGNKIYMPLFQTLSFYEEEGWGVGIVMAHMVLDEQGMRSYVADPEITEVVFNINEDGTISMEGTDEMDESGWYAQNILATVYTDNAAWSGFGDYKSVYSIFNDEPLALPEGLDLVQYSVADDYYGHLLKGAVDGDKIYLVGLYSEMPEAAIVGTIEGDKVAFASDQYLGSYNGYAMYFAACQAELFYYEEYDFWYYGPYEYRASAIFDYDAANGSMVNTENDILLLNRGKAADNISNMSSLTGPTQIMPFVEMPAKPATPCITYFADYFDMIGYSYVTSSLPLEDVNGNFIDPEKVTYCYWMKFDGEAEPYVLYADEYPMVEDGTIELPYTFRNNNNIDPAGDYLTIYVNGFEDIGVQTIYYGGGERHASNISWNSGDETVVEDTTTGIKNITSAKDGQMFDLMGRQTKGGQGLVIVSKDGKMFKAIVK